MILAINGPDNSASTCIDLLTRFFSTHGAPKTIISDNGKYFRSSEVQNFVANKGIKWKFNIEGAPWMGGFFERLVKMVKRCLKKSLWNARVNYQDLITILIQIQNVLNNRPLTYVYDNEFGDVLTPNKLIFGRNIDNEVTKRNPNLENVQTDLFNHKKRVQSNLRHFWSKWRHEYLTELREHNKVEKRTNSIIPNVGDIVIIKDDIKKRYDWRIGKIKELLSSRDGKIRAANVTVITNDKQSMLRRPINKLFPLEVTDNTSNEDNDSDKLELTFVSDDNVMITLIGETFAR